MNYISISDFLSQEYSILGAELTLLRESPDNNIYIVKINGASAYVLRISKRESIIIEDINFEVEIIEEARSKGLKVVKVVRDKVGNLVTKYENKVSVLFVFESGKSTESDIENIPDIKEVMNAGSVLADLHNAWEGYIPKNHKSRSYLTEYERFFKDESFFANNFENGEEVINLAKELYNFALLNDKKEIIHNDFRSQNIFFEENSSDVKLILDFDWSCLGNNIKDISHSMIEWSMPDGVKVPRLELAQAFLDGYKSKRKIDVSLEEFKKWAVFACLSDALNYWIDNKEDQSQVLRSYMYGKAKSVIRGDYDTIII